MNDQSQLLLRSIKGPVIMITVGVLFAADKFTEYHFFTQTWPILLIVLGLLQLVGGRRRRPDYYPPPAPAAPPASTPIHPFAAPTPQPPSPDIAVRDESQESRS